MMAHNVSPHALSSSLNHRSSSYMNQDHIPGRHIPVITVPEILEAFNSSHALSSNTNLSSSVRTSGNDPWELPELKWLDPADNVAGPIENLPEGAENPSVAPEKFHLDGERWPFPVMYAGDRVTASGEDAQFSLQSIVNPSPASSGSSILMKNRINYLSSRDFPSSTQAPEWRNTSGNSGNKRPTCERTDSDFGHGKLSTSERSPFPEKSNPERSAPNTDVSTVTTTYPPEKKSRVSMAADVVPGNRDSSNPAASGLDQKTSAEKGSVSMTNDQTISPGRDSKKSVATVSDHDIHIWTERERRKKMNGMFSTLHSLLPHLTSKADKSTIVDEAINYIQSLEVTMKGLVKRKGEAANSSSTAMSMPTSLALMQASQNGLAEAEPSMSKITPSTGFHGEVKPSTGNGSSRPTSESRFQTLSSPNVVLNICGNDAFITICSPRGRLGLLCRILFVMETHCLHVLNAHISTSDDTIMYMVHAQTTDSQHLRSSDLLNMALQDLTNCLTAHT